MSHNLNGYVLAKTETKGDQEVWFPLKDDWDTTMSALVLREEEDNRSLGNNTIAVRIPVESGKHASAPPLYWGSETMRAGRTLTYEEENDKKMSNNPMEGREEDTKKHNKTTESNRNSRESKLYQTKEENDKKMSKNTTQGREEDTKKQNKTTESNRDSREGKLYESKDRKGRMVTRTTTRSDRRSRQGGVTNNNTTITTTPTTQTNTSGSTKLSRSAQTNEQSKRTKIQLMTAIVAFICAIICICLAIMASR